MNQLVRFDTNALNKALLGFDSLFDSLEHRFANQVNSNYPPYNIIKKDENNYELEVAVTGFDPSEVTVEIDQNQLIIKGEQASDDKESTAQYLHRGLASRDFTRIWTLAEHMEVDAGTIKNGVLRIKIQRVVPEALKPRVLKIIAE
jgi:molecular chaperone IbpA